MANTYTSYDVIGKKEDVSDVIRDLTPTETPFQTSIGKDKVSNIIFTWQEDALDAAGSNAQVDGFDASELAATPTTIRENYTQILAKALKVASTTDAVSTYGRAKETAYQVIKRGKELKRDLEYVLLNAQAGGKGRMNNVTMTSIGNTADAGADTARTMKSFQAQVDSSLLNKTGGANTAMTETLLLDTLEELYNAGASVNTLMIPPAESRNIASYAGSTTYGYREREMSGSDARKIVNAVDFYSSPYGDVKVVLNRFQVNTDHLFYNPSDWKLMTLRPWTRDPLAKIGDSERHMIVGEFSLKHENYKCSAIVRKAA